MDIDNTEVTVVGKGWVEVIEGIREMDGDGKNNKKINY